MKLKEAPTATPSPGGQLVPVPRHILLCLDGSETSLTALEYAVELANEVDAQITLLEVLEPHGSLPGYYTPPENDSDLKEFMAMQRLDKLLPKLEELTNTYQRQVRTGFAAEEILRESDTGAHDLIVMGSHGVGPITRFLVGSVSTKVLHHANIPVIIVREPKATKNIIAAVDGSGHSQLALKHAVGLCNALRAKLVVLEVVEPLGGQPVYFGYPGYYQIPPTSSDLTREIADRRLEKLLPVLGQLEGGFDRIVRKGGPAEEIVAALHEKDYHLAVLGSHGMGALTRMLAGSVSTKVVHQAPCPVMVVR